MNDSGAHLLYPRIGSLQARLLASERGALGLEELRSLSEVGHDLVQFAPTGGVRADRDHLLSVRDAIRAVATRAGYPETPNRARARTFDVESAKTLHTMLRMTAHEASQPGVWAFFACVMLPDLVRWRFPGQQGRRTDPNRFLGGGLASRNTFGRVWWRAHILSLSGIDNPYTIVDRLWEDEFVQIMERPYLGGNPALVGKICESFLETAARHITVIRTELLRDAMKRFRRMATFVAYESVDPADLSELVSGVFAASVSALECTRRQAVGQSR